MAIICANFQLKTFFLQNERLLDDQEIEAPRVDNSPSSHAKDTGKKENKSGKHCPDIKADRGRYPTKSIHYRAITRLPRLRVFRKVAGKHFGYAYLLKPRHVRGFLCKPPMTTPPAGSDGCPQGGAKLPVMLDVPLATHGIATGFATFRIEQNPFPPAS